MRSRSGIKDFQEKLDEESICVICKENKNEILLRLCGHTNICIICLEKHLENKKYVCIVEKKYKKYMLLNMIEKMQHPNRNGVMDNIN